MYPHHSNDVNNKLKNLTDTLRDTTHTLKSSLDCLVSSPTNEFRKRPTTHFSDDRQSDTKSSSFLKIEKSLENISAKQNTIEDELKRVSHSINPMETTIDQSRYSLNNRKFASMNFLDSIDPFSEASFSVSKKLQEAQDKLKSDQISMENRNSALSKPIDISPDLRSALTEKSNVGRKDSLSNGDNHHQMETLTKKVIKYESDNSSLKFECDSLKRQLLSEIGAKNTLLANIDDSKSKIVQLEEQNCVLKKEFDRMTIENDVNKRKADNNTKWVEKLSAVQWENEQLKKDTMHCNHGTEIEDLRRQKEKAERNTALIKDQMLDMTKQMESKQTHISKLMDEIKEMQEKISLNKTVFHELEEKYQESQNELRHRQKIYQDVVNKVDSLEHSMIELEADKNKGFLIRDDNIERLESQCIRFKGEISRFHNEVQENNALMNDLHKENESLRNQLMNAQTQTDALRREMEALIKTRSTQDEILKRREEDNEFCQNKIKDLQLLLENTEKNCDSHKFDAEIYCQDVNQARETIAVQEERLINLTKTNFNQQEQLLAYKSEISILNRKVISLENQISNLNKQLTECQNREEQLEDLRRQLDISKNSQEKMTVDIANNSKKCELENRNNIKKLEEMLNAERAALKVVMNKSDRQMAEISRMHQEYWNREQLVQRFRKKYIKIKQELDILLKQKEVEKNLQQNNFSEEILEKEQELLMEKERMREFIEERDQTLRWLIIDVDGVVELLSQFDVFPDESNKLKSSTYMMKNGSIDLKSCPPTSSALSSLGGLDINKCFIDIKSKISWIRSGLNRVMNNFEYHKNSSIELQEELAIANDRINKLEDEKQLLKDSELEEARNCLAKLRVKEKNEINLQLKCDRLQSELHNVRQYLKDNLTDCNHSHCQNVSYN